MRIALRRREVIYTRAVVSRFESDVILVPDDGPSDDTSRGRSGWLNFHSRVENAAVTDVMSVIHTGRVRRLG